MFPGPRSGFIAANYSPFNDNCSPQTVNFVVDNQTQSLNPADYRWIITDASGTLADQSTRTTPNFSFQFIHSTQAIRVYQVTLRTTLSSLCARDSIKVIRISPVPTSDFSVDTLVFDCDVMKMQFEAVQKGLVEYAWTINVNGLTLFTQIGPEAVLPFDFNRAAAQQDVEVELQTTNGFNCVSTVTTKTFTVPPDDNISISFTASPLLQTLPNSVVTITNNTTAGPWTQAWDFGDGTGVLQWIGWLRLDMNMPVAGGRPVAHMEQANLLCSLLIQGAVGAWRLVCRGRLTARMAVLLCAPILFVVVLTQSRVAWLVGLTLLLLAGWRRDTLPRLHVRVLIGVVILLVLGTLLLPTIDSHLGLTGSTLSERTSQGRRPAAWSLFLDAVTLHPWAGWGVLQNGAAQFAVADRHPSLAYSFSSAHNFLLDLIVWFGVPVGLVVGSALLWGVFQRLARASNASALVTAFAATALVLHASTELALHYAYFLFPLGLYLGATGTERGASTANNIWIPTGGRILLPALSVASAIAVATIGREYIQVTDVRPALWVDRDTRHLVLGADFPPPEVLILDQLRAYHVLAALPLAPNVPAQDLDTANTAMRRTPFSVSIERSALLAGINGRDAESREALQRLCKFATTRQCERSRHAWEIRREEWPGLPNAFPASASD